MAEMQEAREERSLGELFSELAQEVSTLVRQEATLAKAELGQKATRVGRNVAALAAGGAVAYAGLLAILAAIISALVHAGLEWWASALLVGVVVAAIGGFLVMKGINALKSEDLTPRQTLESLKEDAQWARRQTT
jgi:hypothetical protein